MVLHSAKMHRCCIVLHGVCKMQAVYASMVLHSATWVCKMQAVYASMVLHSATCCKMQAVYVSMVLHSAT